MKVDVRVVTGKQGLSLFMLTTLLICVSLFDSDFTLFKGEEGDKISATFKPFTDDSWRATDSSMSKDKFQPTETTVTIPKATPLRQGISTTVFVSTEDVYAFAALKCNAKATVSGALCYGDATDGKEPFYWGILPNVGETRHVQFYKTLSNETLRLTLYLYNENENEDVTFMLPEFWIYHNIYHPLEAAKSGPVPNHPNVIRKTAHITQEMGKTRLHSLILQNAHDMPKRLGDGNFPYSSGLGSYASVPVTANGTHIVGVDIYHDSFIQPWSHGTVLDEETGTTGKTLELSLMARNSSGADITYLVMKVTTTSWLDAVEKWHSEFAEIYHESKGWGLWATFANLQKLFPNSTEDLDLFHVGFQWGSSYTAMKPYIPNHIYSEPTMIHLDIPYNKDTLVNDLTTCEYDPSLEKTEAQKAELKKKCAVALDSALRDADLNLVCREEDEAWNVGLACNVIYEGKAREYFFNMFKNSIESYLERGAPPDKTGGAFDSFSAGRGVTYVDEMNPQAGDGYLPYFLVDSNSKPFVSLHAAMFQAFKDYEQYSPQGMLMNTFYVPPEMVRRWVSAGFEIGLSSESGFTYSDSYWKYFWGARFNGGCRSISHVENRNRKYSIQYTESYMSIMASYGSVSSWFSEDASSDNFWVSPESFAQFRPTLERWMPKMNEAFNGTIFYANQLGLVTMDFPESEQNPPVADEDMSSVALFCRPDDKELCYLSIFIGYQSEDVPSGFSRVAKVKIQGVDSPECFFTANDLECSTSGNVVTVSLRNAKAGQTYRTAVVKFRQNSAGKKKIVAIAVSVTVVLLAVGAAVAIFVIWFTKKRGSGGWRDDVRA